MKDRFIQMAAIEMPKGRIFTSIVFFLVLTIRVSFAQTESFSVKNSHDSSYIYVNTTGKVAIDTSTTLGTLTVNGNDGIIAIGAYASGSALNLGTGTRMMWYPKKGAFRAGYAYSTEWNDSTIGNFSTAKGWSAKASGAISTALGDLVTASGNYSTALGYNTTASGDYSVAIGLGAKATYTGGISIGYSTTASGAYSTAMGQHSSTNGKSGSIVFGDGSASGTVSNSADNQFMVRAAGGFVLYTAELFNYGVTLGASSNSWASISDSTKKENFASVNGEDVLSKIGSFDLRTWNYKGQDPRALRHYGPMAQEFFNAFGHDAYGVIGNDTTISTAEFDGINLIAIQALEKRTSELKIAVGRISGLEEDAKALRTELQTQNEIVASLRSQISQLQQLVDVLVRQTSASDRTVLTSNRGK